MVARGETIVVRRATLESKVFRTRHSLRSKRFRGVFCTKKPIFLFLDAREMGRERKKGGGRGGEREKGNLLLLSPPPPLLLVFALAISRASKTTKIGFFAKNATVTLATQAKRGTKLTASYVDAPTVINTRGLCLGDNLSTDA